MAKKILLIEYEPRYLDRVRGYLAGKDFDLVVAKDGDEGLQLFLSSRPDLVLVSSVLPKLRTSDVIKGIQAHPAPPPIVVMMSGYKGTDRRADAHRVGAASILEKPFTEESFNAELAAAFAGAAPAQALRDYAGAGPLFSSDDIFSDLLSGMDEDRSGAVRSATPSTPAAPAPARGGTDAGIQKRLEQTLSGILATSKKTPGPMPVAPSPAPDLASLLGAAGAVSEKTMRVELPPPAAAPKPAPRPAPKSDASVDRLLTDTLSGLRTSPKAAPEPKSSPRVPALDLAGIESSLGRGPSAPKASAPAAAASAPAAPATAAAGPSGSAAPVLPSAASPKAPAPGAVPATASPFPARSGAPAKGEFGRYALLERIAAGGMAEVYKARMSGEEGFEKIVAIKRILPHMADSEDFITMFIDEAKLAAQLTHNNIIHIYDLGKVDAYHYIAMEYVEGKDLRTIVKMGRERGFPLPVELALLVASKVANALDYAHRRVGIDGREMGLVHRDVSPQNILISMEGDIKLCDFGIAKATTNMAQTQSGALKGKLQYMSPEQAWGKKLDRRSDIFSLGLVLYEMLTGEKLFRGETDLSILDAVREGRVKPPSEKNPEVTPRIDQVVLRALAKEPNDRYQNASEFEKDVNAVLYSYQPAPGPADLAIHMHRLLEATPELSDERFDAAFAQVAPVEKGAQGGAGGSGPRKGKGLVISKKAAVAAPITATAATAAATQAPAKSPVSAAESRSAVPADTGSASSSAVSAGSLPVEQGKSRTGLFAGIGLAAAVLVGGGIYLSRGSGGGASSKEAPTPSGSAAVPASPAAPASPSVPGGAVAPSGEPAKVIDQKALEAEVKKQAGAEADRLRKEAAAVAAGAGKGLPPAAAPAGAAKPGSLAEAQKAPTTAIPPVAAAAPSAPAAPVAAPPAPTAAPARPTAEPVRVAEAAPKPAAEASIPAPPPVPAAAGPAKEGDLVGPGTGVVEPKIVKLGAYTLGPQAKQIATRRGESSLGTVVIMALVSEKGTITETRIVRKSNYPFVDEAALTALKGAAVEPATKDGVRVKMYKAFPITVKP